MKKLLGIALSLIISMSLMTGCTGDTETSTTPQPTPTPAATPAPATETETDFTESPNYQTVLLMWEDMDGYWAAGDGHYLVFSLDDSGKAQLHTYDKEGKLISYAITKAVMASNKTSYIMELVLPKGEFEGIIQHGKELTYNIEIAGYGDGYVEISADGTGRTVYAFAGADTTKMKEAVKYAVNIEKAAKAEN